MSPERKIEIRRHLTALKKGKTLEMMFGVQRAVEIRAKLRAAATKAYATNPAVRAALERGRSGKHPDRGRKIKEVWSRPNFKEQFVAKRRAWLATDDGLRYRERISEFMKRRQAELWADPHHPYNSEEYRQKIGAANSGNSYAKGHIHSEEAKRKNSEAHKKLWEDPEYGLRNMRSNHRKPNGQEWRLSYIIRRAVPRAFRYNGDGRLKFAIPHHIPDWIDTGQSCAIELLGEYWHGPKRRKRSNQEEEARIAADYRKHGLDCLLIWERELEDKVLVKAKVREFLYGSVTVA